MQTCMKDANRINVMNALELMIKIGAKNVKKASNGSRRQENVLKFKRNQ